MNALRKILLLGFIAAVVGAAVWLGFIDPRRVRAGARNAVNDLRHISGQVIESPRGPATSAMQAAGACRQNLRRLESAKRAIHSRGGFATGAVSWDAVLAELRTGRPVCPSGGEYRLGTIEQLPTCTVGGNGTAEADDDHAIRRF